MASLDEWKKFYPDKFTSEEIIFSNIRHGDRIFVSSGCGEPQYLIQSLMRFVESHPKSFFDTEVFHVYSMGLSPYTEEKFKGNFRHNSFFIGNNTRDSVNTGNADYSPVSLSDVPALLKTGLVRVDVALIQTSVPDEHGFLSLGISVDIVKAATEKATLIIAQVNKNMPRIHGDGFIHISDVNFIIPHDESLIQLTVDESDAEEAAGKIGRYVARLIRDGDTIQVGFGPLPNAILASLHEKKHLGIHTELLGDGLVSLLKAGVVDNSQKTLNHGKTVASFAMGSTDTYRFLHDNPSIFFRTIDYTNNPLIIAQHKNIVAINSALEIDLTGQATSESIGDQFYSGVGGFQDFMRGALMAVNGRTILVMKSTAIDGTISRIVPSLKESAGVTLSRADVCYVVTEYGIAYLHGKNIRERAMRLIAIAHPKFRSRLIEEAKKRGLIYPDQRYITTGEEAWPEYPETYRTTKTGVQIFIRPVKISDEPPLKDFFYSLSDKSLYRRFMSERRDMHHERLQEILFIDYTKAALFVVTGDEHSEDILATGQYYLNSTDHTAEVALVVKDEYQAKGIGTELLSYLSYIAMREGLLGFTASVLAENVPMLHLFEKSGFGVEKRNTAGVYELAITFGKSV
ncbi:MAG: GNAT family N-acetyltransferase [Deltaproteobacteria bacterium]|nr:GNAT family N-acetyltransferase [Deltaproteobacteria bacterium]